MQERESYRKDFGMGSRIYYGDPFEIDCICCDGTGQEEGDQAEYDKRQKEIALDRGNYDEDF